MPLDNFNDPARAPRSGELHRLLPLLLRELGPAWSWDDTHQDAVRIRDSGDAVFKLIPEGGGMLDIEAVMPERFMPAPSASVLFDDSVHEIAQQIRRLVRQFHAVTRGVVEHQDDEERWKNETRELLERIGEELQMTAMIEEGNDPGLNLSVLFQRRFGDSLRINAQPGAGPSVVLYVPTMLDLWPFITAFSRVGQPPDTPEAKLARAIDRLATALARQDPTQYLKLRDLMLAAGLWWSCATQDCGGGRYGPADTKCTVCGAPRPAI